MLLILFVILLLYPSGANAQAQRYGVGVPSVQGLVVWYAGRQGFTGGPWWYDVLGNAHATLSHTSGWAASTCPGQAGEVRFDGSNDYVPFPTNLSLVGGEYTFITSMRNTVGGGSYAFDVVYGGNRTAISTDGGNWAGNAQAISANFNNGDFPNLGDVGSIPATVCSRIAVTFSVAKNTVIGYVNGRATGNATYSESFGAGSPTGSIGARYSADASFVNGAIAEVRWYQRVLTSQEIMGDYQETLKETLQRSETPSLGFMQVIGGTVSTFFRFFSRQR